MRRDETGRYNGGQSNLLEALVSNKMVAPAEVQKMGLQQPDFLVVPKCLSLEYGPGILHVMQRSVCGLRKELCTLNRRSSTTDWTSQKAQKLKPRCSPHYHS